MATCWGIPQQQAISWNFVATRWLLTVFDGGGGEGMEGRQFKETGAVWPAAWGTSGSGSSGGSVKEKNIPPPPLASMSPVAAYSAWPHVLFSTRVEPMSTGPPCSLWVGSGMRRPEPLRQHWLKLVAAQGGGNSTHLAEPRKAKVALGQGRPGWDLPHTSLCALS